MGGNASVRIPDIVVFARPHPPLGLKAGLALLGASITPGKLVKRPLEPRLKLFDAAREVPKTLKEFLCKLRSRVSFKDALLPLWGLVMTVGKSIRFEPPMRNLPLVPATPVPPPRGLGVGATKKGSETRGVSRFTGTVPGRLPSRNPRIDTGIRPGRPKISLPSLGLLGMLDSPFQNRI